MNILKKYGVNFIILLIVVVFSVGRATLYGDLRLSIGNGETDSYINSSLTPVFSWKIFAGERMFSTNLIYKMANDPVACPSLNYSMPSSGDERPRQIVPCFGDIALLQNLISIFGWVLLALITAKHLENGLVKLIATLIILIFGFTPQLAEWDSVLGPEPLSISLFIILLALTMELAFRAARSEQPFKSRTDIILLTAWGLVLFFWVFIRDVHLYALAGTLGLILIAYIAKKFRSARSLTATLVFFAVVVVVGYISAGDSFRAARYPVVNAIDEYVWPHPARVEFFREYGMPDREDESYQAWADHNAAKAYAVFLISHPGFIVNTAWEYIDYFSFDSAQAFYPTKDLPYRDTLYLIGRTFHLESLAIYVISALLLFTLLLGALQGSRPTIQAWAWLALWAFAISFVTLFLSFFGDIYGTRRHIMPSVVWFRLYMWFFLMPILDQYVSKNSR